MRARRFATANKVFSLPGGTEDNDLWVQAMVVEDEMVGRAPAIVSVWQPSDEERQRIAAGENVELTVLGTGQPPVLMAVTDVPLGAPKAEEPAQ